MRSNPTKLPLFVFEALGSLACGFYGNYIFFYLRDRHGFGDLGNLGAAALMGLVIALASWKGGRLAQKHGLTPTMFAGLFGMILALGAGATQASLIAQLMVLVFWTASQFLIWPALEALVTENEDGPSRARTVGIYSVVWATCSALSYFLGGAVFERLGHSSIFWLPPLFHVLQLVLLLKIARDRKAGIKPESLSRGEENISTTTRPANARVFQRMAWLANPFACVAAFTLLAMMPELARRFGLSTTLAGLFCSIWFFARLATFVMMWLWPGWHYRFRWLLSGYLLLIVGFAAILLAENLLWLGAGQIAFGLAVGCLYYASLFYSMDVGEARAEQGGIHEALMGAGNFVGPGIGALSLILTPKTTHAGVWSVGALLIVGFGILIGIRLKGKA